MIQVDTMVVPPRATWVHPCEDEKFLQNLESNSVENRELSDPPPYREKPERRHSFGGEKHSGSLLLPIATFPDNSMPDLHDHSQSKRGFFGKLKDTVMSLKEEIEERKRVEQMERERRADMLLRQSYLRQQQYRGSAPYHRSYYGCTSASAYPDNYPPPPGPPGPSGVIRFPEPCFATGST